MKTEFQTNYGKIILEEKEFDSDFPNSTFFEMYDEDNGYYGEFVTHNPNDITAKEIEEQIMENLNY